MRNKSIRTGKHECVENETKKKNKQKVFYGRKINRTRIQILQNCFRVLISVS